MLELAKIYLKTKSPEEVLSILIGGGLDSLEAAKVLVQALEAKIGKIKMQKIDLIWHEGTGEFDGTTYTDWNAFNEVLEKIAVHHGDDFGYSKTKFKLTWEDGEIFSGRLDVNTRDDKNLGKHILQQIRFYAGLLEEGKDLPSHFTAESYRSFLADMLEEGETEEYKQALDKYEIVV